MPKSCATLTRRELAALLGVHLMTVTKWEQAGLPIARRGGKGRPSRYRERDVRAWLATREKLAETGVQRDLIQERAAKEHWQALLAEQTHQQRAGELISAVEVERSLAAYIAAARAKLLSAPITYADRVHRAATRQGLAGVEASLKDLAHEVLRELADLTALPAGGRAA